MWTDTLYSAFGWADTLVTAFGWADTLSGHEALLDTLWELFASLCEPTWGLKKSYQTLKIVAVIAIS
jgi:hypothetical protein